MGMAKIWRLWRWLKVLPEDALVLYYAWKHPYTPPYVKGLLMALATYVISPIDILPDYIPVVGIVDDAVIITTAVWYLTNLLPVSVRSECYSRSTKWRRRLPILVGLIVLMVIIWLVLLVNGIKYLFS